MAALFFGIRELKAVTSQFSPMGFLATLVIFVCLSKPNAIMQLKGALVCLLIVIIMPVMAQFKNVQLGTVGGTGVSAAELSVAIDPRRPQNRVVRAGPDQVYYTGDGGVSWQAGKLTSLVGLFGAPAVIADPKGIFYSFQVSGPNGDAEAGASETSERLVVQRSEDGGANWSAGEFFGLNPPGYRWKQWATVDEKGNLFVTWTQFNRSGAADSACTSRILFSTSKNGKKWSEPIVISRLDGNCIHDGNTALGAMPAVTLDGKVVISWANNGKIFLDRSFNGGDMWLSNDIVVQEQPGGWHLDIPGHSGANGLPVLMTDKSKYHYRGSLYLVWSDQRNGADDTDIWFTRSHNYGDNWSTPMRVNDDGKGRHQYMPWMTVDQATGYLYVLYYDRRNHTDHQTDVYLAWSADGGTSFKSRMISDRPFTPVGDATVANCSISAHKGVIVPVWTRVDDGTTSVWTTTIDHEALTKAPAAE